MLNLSGSGLPAGHSRRPAAGVLADDRGRMLAVGRRAGPKRTPASCSSRAPKTTMAFCLAHFLPQTPPRVCQTGQGHRRRDTGSVVLPIYDNIRPPGTERKTAKILDTVHTDYRIRSSDFSDKTIAYRLSFGVNCPIF
jgi:hypothetical protein